MESMSATTTPSPEALVVIDVQAGFDDLAYWGPTTNPDAEQNVARLIAHWRQTRRGPVVIVRHDSASSTSPLHPAGEGNRLKDCAAPEAGDLLVVKQVNSAFYGDPDLHSWLGDRGVHALVICGIQTNMCVETTARMAGNLGYRTTVPLDATRTFDLSSVLPDGTRITLDADSLVRTTAVNLQAGGFATVTTTNDVLAGPVGSGTAASG